MPDDCNFETEGPAIESLSTSSTRRKSCAIQKRANLRKDLNPHRKPTVNGLMS